MLFQFTVFIAVVACQVAAQSQVDFDIVAFRDWTYVTDANPDANLNFHCVEMQTDWSTGNRIPYSVHGVFGQRGYFEGNFSPNVQNNALISTFELSAGWMGVVPLTQAGVLSYSPGFQSFSAQIWASGQSNASWINSWSSYTRCDDCVPQFVMWSWENNTFVPDYQAKVDFAEANCLWNPNDRVFWSRPEQDMNNEIFSAPNSSEVFTTAGVGSMDTNGQLMGAYTFHYSPEQCQSWGLDCEQFGSNETGYYSLNSVSAYLMNGRVGATTWHATTGPMAGRNGSYIFTIRTNSYYSDLSKASLSGFWCVAESPYPWETILTGCQRVHAFRTHHSKDEGRNLLNAYNALVNQPKEGNLIYTLKWFANKVFGKWL